MAGNARFHDKLHRKNHHTNPTVGYADSASDPIASPTEPFQGDFILNGKLSANSGINVLSANIVGDLTCEDLIVKGTTFTNFISGDSTEAIISDGGLTGFGNNTLTLDYGKGIYNRVNNNTIMYMNSSNVGIGTVTPNEKLTVIGNISTNGEKINLYSSVSDAIIKSHSDAGNAALQLNNGSLSPGSGPLINFQLNDSSIARIRGITSLSSITFETSNVEKMRITSEGNVGIGTTTPTEKLHVDGNVLITGNLSALGGTTQIDTTIVTTSAMVIDMAGSADALRITQRGTGNALLVEDEASDSTAFIINSAGDVGIGINTPHTKLHVDGSITVPSDSYVNFLDNSDGDTAIKRNGSDNGLEFFTNSASRMFISDSGNVGIGTNTPNKQLTIVGEISATSDIFSNEVYINRGNDQHEGGQINFNRPVDNTTAWAIDAYTDNVGSLSSRFRVIDVISSTEKFTILSSGNVGIGVAIPTSKLDVNGDVSFTGELFLQNPTTNYTSIRLGSDDDAGFYITKEEETFTTPNSFNIWNGAYGITSVSRMSILTSGNVGMGVVNPTENLHVFEDNAGGQTVIKVENSSNTNGSQARFDMTTGTTSSYSVLYVEENSVSGPYTAWEQGEGVIGGTYIRSASAASIYLGDVNANRLTMLSGGNVGIGIDNPNTKLHVNGALTLNAENLSTPTSVDSSNLSGVYISFDAFGTSDWAYLRQIGTPNNFHLALDIHDEGLIDPDGQSFSIRNVASSNSSPDPEPITLFTINAVGNVGIGVSNPNTKLYVDGNTTIEGKLIVDSGNGNNNIAIGNNSIAANNGSDNISIGVNSLFTSTSGDKNILIGNNALYDNLSGNNNVSIGYGVSSSNLTVSNEVNIYNGAQTARFQGTAGAWSFVSDARDKQNITDLSIGLDFINQLNPRKFEWNMRHSDVDKGKPSSGFIAQEVLEVLISNNAEYTNLVDTKNPNQYTVSQSNLIPILVKAVQDLNKKIESQAIEIIELKSKIK